MMLSGIARAQVRGIAAHDPTGALPSPRERRTATPCALLSEDMR